MSKNSEINWEYAEFSKDASGHGGPKAYIDELKAGSYEEGKTDGMIEGGLIVGAFGLLAVVLKVAWNKWQSRATLRARKHAPEEELEAMLREYEAQQMSEGNENVNPSVSYAVPSEEERDQETDQPSVTD